MEKLYRYLKLVKKLSINWMFITTFLLVGCSTDVFRLNAPTREPREASDYLNFAAKCEPPRSTAYRLRAAILMIKANEIPYAQGVLREAQNFDPNLDSNIREMILEARHSLLKQDTGRAVVLLNSAAKMLEQSIPDTLGFKMNGPAKRIALLLPSKGPHAEAAKTIKEGFFTAYYKNKTPDTTIKVFDTGEGNKIQEAYQQAITEQSDFIIGPLTKPEVQAIIHLQPQVPVLALNTVSDKTSLPKNIFQFGLIPEDEIFALVDTARRQGHGRALIVAPDSDWGHRMTHTFKQVFEASGGTIVETLHIQLGQDVPAKIQSLLQAKQGKHRQDIDMLFLAASSDFGRQIKPLLNYYHAESLPVYATASVYSGIPSPMRDQDLNGIHFCDMPGILSASAKPTAAFRSPRFFALGMDAFELVRHLGQNQSLFKISGMTGELIYNSKQQRIQRNLTSAEFKNGIPVIE